MSFFVAQKGGKSPLYYIRSPDYIKLSFWHLSHIPTEVFYFCGYKKGSIDND